jgi:hypothetical protein
MQLRNNIIRLNTATSSAQISGSSGVSVAYSDIEGGWQGQGVIDADPNFADSSFILTGSSPCVDAGQPDDAFNDPADGSHPGQAAWPSMGGWRNDMGAYGGPGRSPFFPLREPSISFPVPSIDLGYLLPGDSRDVRLAFLNLGPGPLSVDSARVLHGASASVRVITPLPAQVHALSRDTLVVRWTPAVNELLADTLLIFHNDTTRANPARIPVHGNSNPVPVLNLNTDLYDFGAIDVNTPQRDTTFTAYNVGTSFDSVYVSINYRTVKPDSSLSVQPQAFRISPGDSQLVKFTVLPRLVIKSGLGFYSPSVLIDSRFGAGTTHFEKFMKFRLAGTLDVKETGNTPARFALDQCYPNPFNPATVVSFQLPVASVVRLAVYDLLGREVGVLVDERRGAGTYVARFYAEGLASGVYLYRIVTRPVESAAGGGYVATKSMVLVK